MTTAITKTTIRCEFKIPAGKPMLGFSTRCPAEARFLVGHPGEKGYARVACADCLPHYITSVHTLVVALDKGGYDHLRGRITEMQSIQQKIVQVEDAEEWELRDRIVQDTRRYMAMLLQPRPEPCRMECCIPEC